VVGVRLVLDTGENHYVGGIQIDFYHHSGCQRAVKVVEARHIQFFQSLLRAVRVAEIETFAKSQASHLASLANFFGRIQILRHFRDSTSSAQQFD